MTRLVRATLWPQPPRRKALAGVAALLAASCAVASANDTPPMPRLASVTGQGEVTALPDMAQVTLGVEARKPTLAEARGQVSAAVERLLALTRDLGIEPKHVDSSQLQVQPDYRWNEKDRQRVLLGYVVSRQVNVELRDLDQLGTLMERAVSAGANQVHGARLDSSRRKELEREALTAAVADARQEAETLARAAGVKLGPVYRLEASSDGPPVFHAKAMASVSMDAAAEAAAETYEVAEMKFTASVSAQWELQVASQ